MTKSTNLIALHTLVRKEVVRFIRIWAQTILPPAITMALYFVIFGNLIGSQIGTINGFTYMQFITPGLIMMSIISNAYANVSSSFFSMRFQRSIEELVVSPMPNYLLLLGFTLGGVLRGVTVGIVVTVLSLFFTKLHLHHLGITLLIPVLAAILFSLAGFTNGLFAKKFDDISIIPTFVITPLTYLGGVFYSLKLLPSFWQPIAHINPVLYMVDALRYGILGISDVSITVAISMLSGFVVALFIFNLYLLHKGVGIRS